MCDASRQGGKQWREQTCGKQTRNLKTAKKAVKREQTKKQGLKSQKR